MNEYNGCFSAGCFVPFPISRLLWNHRRARPLFDKKFYLARYPDVAAAGADPWLHYLTHGAAERRKPNPLFDPNYYLAQRPDAGAGELEAKTDPLMHFVQARNNNRVNPHPLFDCESYLRANPDVAREGSQPSDPLRAVRSRQIPRRRRQLFRCSVALCVAFCCITTS